MIRIEAWVEGTAPILLHRFSTNAEAESGKQTRKVQLRQEVPRVTCEQSVYRAENGALALPCAAFARLIREAGGAHKQRGSRKSLKYIVPAAVRVLGDLAPLYCTDRATTCKDFEIDSRSVVIPSTKGRVMRHRARVNSWACRVDIQVNDDLLDEATVRQLLIEGVQQNGIGDFRPERGGPFGTAHLVSWEAVGMSPPQPIRSGARNAATEAAA